MKATQLFCQLLLIAASSLLCIGSFAQNTYPNGQIKSNGDSTNGKYLEYYENGKLKSEAMLAKGVLTGVFIEYFDNGQLKRKMHVDSATGINFKSVKSGRCTEYYEDGNLKGKASMIKGKLDGEFITYYGTGKMEMKGMYVKGKREGEWTSFYENGEVKEKGFFKNDEAVRKNSVEKNGGTEGSNKFLNGQVKTAGNKVNGEFIEYYPKGQVESKKHYKKGVLDGPILKYYLHGALQEKAAYLNGELNGEFLVYQEDGTVMMKRIYDHGKLVEEKKPAAVNQE